MIKKITVCLLLIAAIVSCHSSGNKKAADTIMTVSSKAVTKSLYYAGNVQPAAPVALVAPTDGVIEKKYVHYGDVVKKGQLLFSVSSEKFQADYKTALMQYIKAKNEFNTNQSQLKEGIFLHKNELISDDDFKMRQTNFYNAQLGLLQAKDALGQLIKQLNLTGVSLYKLSIADIDKITALLHTQSSSEAIQLYSPADGIVLASSKSDATADKKVQSGEQVKQGDVLALIADRHSFTIQIAVNEFDINQLKVGQAVSVTGPAFVDLKLSGLIVGVDHQAQTNQAGQPSFSVDVQVANLTESQEELIHIGMSAKVQIDLQESASIQVPLAAVTEKNGLAYVKQKDIKTGRIKEVAVTVGKTTADSIVILSNLAEGDSIVIPG